MKYSLISLLIIASNSLFGQLDSSWNHSLDEADVVLKINVTKTYYITDGGIFEAEVLEVVKGSCKRNKISWSMGMIEISTERWEKRYRAIWPEDLKTPFTTYVGFNIIRKNLPDDPSKPFSNYYEYFMSSKVFD